jgi:hypothetical protein
MLPPSVLPDISPARGKIGLALGTVYFLPRKGGYRGERARAAKSKLSPAATLGEMSGRTEGGSTRANLSLLALLAAALAAILCFLTSPALAVSAEAILADTPPKLLSEFGFFDDLPKQRPAAGVVPFHLATPLFSDNALKFRFVYVPVGQQARYDAVEAFDFPVGTALIKTFAFPADYREPNSNLRLIETRVLLDWRDASAPVERRARIWLDVNCAHCHRAEGPAGNSGLFLTAGETDPVKFGVMKRPAAAGKGTGGREFDIVPGDPERSILIYRVESTEPGVMMPELGRHLADPEAVRLLGEWVKTLH